MSSKYTERLIIVIPAVHQDEANQFAKSVDPTTDLNTFTAGLSTNGDTPATHYWCSWALTESQYGQLTWMDVAMDGVSVFDASEMSFDKVLETLNLKSLTETF